MSIFCTGANWFCRYAWRETSPLNCQWHLGLGLIAFRAFRRYPGPRGYRTEPSPEKSARLLGPYPTCDGGSLVDLLAPRKLRGRVRPVSENHPTRREVLAGMAAGRPVPSS